MTTAPPSAASMAQFRSVQAQAPDRNQIQFQDKETHANEATGSSESHQSTLVFEKGRLGGRRGNHGSGHPDPWAVNLCSKPDSKFGPSFRRRHRNPSIPSRSGTD